jgi:hypothetical protein
MENFFNYISKPLEYDEIDIWFKANNIIFEKMDLFFDFTYSLTLVITETYLGGGLNDNESEVEMTDEDNQNHFDWCWKKTIENFSKEGVMIETNGEHYDYFNEFFNEIFYNNQESKIKKSIANFFEEMFDRNKPFTKSDLDVLLTIYKSIDNNMTIIY